MRTADGSVRVDPTGKEAGRGAYLCVNPDCWKAAGLRGRLGAALRTTVSDQDYQALREFGADFPPVTPEAG